MPQILLEIKRTLITRLKLADFIAKSEIHKNLKSKEPRLRDWNKIRMGSLTAMKQLEIKRTSITRLKRQIWIANWLSKCLLEIKRTSITRLKLG